MISGNVLGALYLQLPMGMKDLKMGNDYYKIPSEDFRSNR